jgi:4-phytase / acid phosphatase
MSRLLRSMTTLSLAFFAPFAFLCQAQSHAPALENRGQQLIFVVYLSRHGVRSPTGNPAQYNSYSAAPWPAWSVPPGYLTPHGYRLMRIFGRWDRQQLASEGLLSATGCVDAAHVTFYADSDERTQETGKALAEGLLPGCATRVQGRSAGVHDPLFHPLETPANANDSALALASIAGRIGGDPNNPTEAYRARLTEMNSMLSTCGDPPAESSPPKHESILDVPAALVPGNGSHPAELRGPLSTASTLAEVFLLEYTEGMDTSNVGWGCVDGKNVRSFIELHTAASEFTQRPAAVARLQASNLLRQIRLALQQAASGKPVAGTVSRADDHALFLIGHDTNITNVAGLLDLHWIADGQSDGTPPSAALVFELWRSRSDGKKLVRVLYTAQTLEQMRLESTLDAANMPVRIPVFIPGCSGPDLSCALPEFERLLTRATEGTVP